MNLSQMGIMPDGKPIVMGILNCTPDSFFEGSRKQTETEIAQRAEQIVREGGSIIDIGAFSTRPGAMEVTEEEELKRMRFALSIVRKQLPDAILSIDTFRPAVARMTVEEFGANIINDVSEGGITGITGKPLAPSSIQSNSDGVSATDEALLDENIPAIFQEVARLRVPYILMSVQKDMDTMIENFRREVAMLARLGVNDVILDPGYGFGKDVVSGNYKVLCEQHRLREAFPSLPILAGLSRKRMIWQLVGGTAQDDSAMQGTMILNMIALQNGASILRVHDVAAARFTIENF